MRILHRYIWKEFLQQFVLWGSIILVLGIGKIFFDYNDIFIGYRVNADMLIRLLLHQLPSLLMDVIPFASLLGTLLFLGRFLRERELDVFRLSGASLFQIMIPVYVGVAIICIGAFLWNDDVVPAANYRFQQEVNRLSTQQDLPLLRENVIIKGPNNRFIYINQVNHKLGEISGVMIIEAGVTGKWARLITADKGYIKRNTWELHQGFIHQFDQSGAVISELKYDKMDLQMSNDLAASMDDSKSPNEMRISDLVERINLNNRSGLKIPSYLVSFHMKFADPLISLILVFLAVPLTIMIGRNARWLGFVYCILIILAYYTLQVIGRTMGANGLIPAWVAAWTPHFVFLALGILMLVRLEQRG